MSHINLAAKINRGLKISVDNRRGHADSIHVLTDEWRDGVDFDRTEFGIAGVGPRSGCWSLFKKAQVAINEGEECASEYDLIDFDRDPHRPCSGSRAQLLLVSAKLSKSGENRVNEMVRQANGNFRRDT